MGSQHYKHLLISIKIKRAASAYVVTFLVSLLLLFLFDKAPLDDLRVTLTRTILVAFPASFAATTVDFMKEGAREPLPAPYPTKAVIGRHSLFVPLRISFRPSRVLLSRQAF